MMDFLKEYIIQHLPFVLSAADGRGNKGIKLNIGRIIEMLVIGLVTAYFTTQLLSVRVDYLEKRIERIEESVQRIENRLYETTAK
ncbi:MAG: hypothetical protein DDT19_01949 [Syntrophomonadaceae bacterium]|nr:hypothetical protein [Bacillota bacterium]